MRILLLINQIATVQIVSWYLSHPVFFVFRNWMDVYKACRYGPCMKVSESVSVLCKSKTISTFLSQVLYCWLYQAFCVRKKNIKLVCGPGSVLRAFQKGSQQYKKTKWEAQYCTPLWSKTENWPNSVPCGYYSQCCYTPLPAPGYVPVSAASFLSYFLWTTIHFIAF